MPHYRRSSEHPLDMERGLVNPNREVTSFWSPFGDAFTNLAHWWRNEVKGERDAKQWELDMYNRRKQDELEAWNRQNEYNSYANQMALAAQAGLNPHLVSTQGAQAGSLNVPSSNHNPIRSADGLFNALGGVAAIPDYIAKFIRIKRELASLNRQEIENKHLDTKLNQFNQISGLTLQYLGDYYKARNYGMTMANSLKEKQDATFLAGFYKKMAGLSAQIDKWKAETGNINLRTTSLIPSQVAVNNALTKLHGGRYRRLMQQMAIDKPAETLAGLRNQVYGSPTGRATLQRYIAEDIKADLLEAQTRGSKAQTLRNWYDAGVLDKDPFAYRMQINSGAPQWLITTQSTVDNSLNLLGKVVDIINPFGRLLQAGKKLKFDMNKERGLYKQRQAHHFNDWHQRERRYRSLYQPRYFGTDYVTP